jgi:hypothetical protein
MNSLHRWDKGSSGSEILALTTELFSPSSIFHERNPKGSGPSCHAFKGSFFQKAI